jgi:hypothetical protein
MKLGIWVLILMVTPVSVAAQAPIADRAPGGGGIDQPRVAPTAAATRVTTPPQLDGRLNDPVWAQAPVINTFTQRDPQEGQPASEQTEVRIVYDDEAVYIGARLHDRSPVTTRLGRRDMALSASDWFRVSLDSYHDRRTAFRFDVNPSGVRRDAALGVTGTGFGGGGGGGGGFTGAEGDLAWDAVWDAAVSTDPDGWTVEMRIPFSQLRFTRAEEQVWGLQLERIIDRTQELSLFAFSPRSETGGVAAFGDLTGLRGVRPGRRLELIPYVVSEGTFAETADNPFARDREFGANAGLDARYRLTPNLTLSATINPDFGQVEVDPAIINLSAFETRLEEKRPFFVEGASSFRFGGNIQGPGANAANLLYSRRIGRVPQVSLRAEQADAAGVTNILGALKLSGKTSNGWAIGMLNAVTNEENRNYLDAQGTRREGVVEPLANYFTARLNREMRRGQSALGGIVTAVHRDLADDGAAATLRSSAYMGGVDLLHEWANRSWALGAFAVAGVIRGSPAAILDAQRSSARYYQRPDSRALEVDPGATSLAGYASTVQLRKASGLHWTGDLWVGVVSPGLEINDLGFQQRSDRISTGGAMRYSQRRPGAVLRNWGANVSQNHSLNWDGDLVERTVRGNVSMTHLNYWDLSIGTSYSAGRVDDRLTRGGPLGRVPAAWTASTSIGSDPRKSVTADVSLGLGGDAAGGRSRTLSTSVELRTSPQWNLSVGPRFEIAEVDAQYVTTVPDASATRTYAARYVFAPLERTELSLVTRFNYTFTPDLTLEFYAQPLIANGEYGTPRQFQTPARYDFAVYGTELGTLERSGSRWVVDPDGAGPIRSFEVPDRSFTTRSLRGNAVLRWEYRPGSTFYLVWQQEHLNPELVGDFRIGSELGRLFEGQAKNVFVLKWTYWFNP